MIIPSLVVNGHCQLAENPLWRAEDNALYWTDIEAGKLFRYHAASGVHETIYEGESVGGFTFQEDGALLLFRVRDIALLRNDGSVQSIIPFQREGAVRFNDVIADPEGRVFAGTIGRTSTSGGLYRLDPDGMITELFTGTGCSNGMGFSPDLSAFYWSCTTTRRIFRFRYDRATGELSNREIFHEVAEGEGMPDGLCVDTSGSVWSARWEGYRIVKYSALGAIVGEIKFPVAKVTSMCFGGRDLDTLFVTTAGGSAESESQDGGIYAVPLPSLGLPEFRSRLRV
jgi:sugar lactone lactonase YvrE